MCCDLKLIYTLTTVTPCEQIQYELITTRKVLQFRLVTTQTCYNSDSLSLLATQTFTACYVQQFNTGKLLW